jgi:hypothetical protein
MKIVRLFKIDKIILPMVIYLILPKLCKIHLVFYIQLLESFKVQLHAPSPNIQIVP